MNLNDVLGGFGAGTKVSALGKEWTFVFDVPAMAANIEEMCKQARRRVYEDELLMLPERSIPGSFDNQQATALWNEFRAEIRSGACKIAHNGNPGGGPFYREWIATQEGKMSTVLAALRVQHPDATLQNLVEIANAAPGQFQAVFDDLGKAIRDAVPKMAASLKDSAPDVAIYLTDKLKEMETSLSGSPEQSST